MAPSEVDTVTVADFPLVIEHVEPDVETSQLPTIWDMFVQLMLRVDLLTTEYVVQ
ncbi:hypothetical protein GCM10009592_25590 [Brachybacterium rhamnosum]